MNFVGHVYLSGEEEQTAVGNFIGDYVKGSQYSKYPDGIRQGIIIHRDIDTTMDLHPSFAAARNIFRSTYGRYAGVVVDVAFDYILTKNWNEWHEVPLQNFTHNFYDVLLRHFRTLPPAVKEFLPLMIKSNRLYSYHTLEGIEKALNTMSNYTSLPNHHQKGIETIRHNEQELTHHFYLLLCDLAVYLNSKYKLPYNAKAAIQIERHRTLEE